MTETQSPVILLAPGAGAGSASDWMRGWRDRLSALGSVETLDYPYRLAGRKTPDKLPVLVAAHRAALAAARARHPGRKVVLAGKSMGGRVGCHASLEEPPGALAALVCLGYPLRGAGGGLRDEVLRALRTPVLFVQGTRDPLCPLTELETVRSRMTAPNQLFVVEGGNHSLEVPRARGSGAAKAAKAEKTAPEVTPQQASDARVLAAIREFLVGKAILAVATLALAGGCALTKEAATERLADGTYRLKCSVSLPRCLDHAEKECHGTRYAVLSAVDRHDYMGSQASVGESESRTSEALIRCGTRGRPMFGKDDVVGPVAPSDAAPSAEPAPAAAMVAAGPARACVPGSTQTCVGPGACRGGQACRPDGGGFSACDCGGSAAAPPPPDAAPGVVSPAVPPPPTPSPVPGSTPPP